MARELAGPRKEGETEYEYIARIKDTAARGAREEDISRGQERGREMFRDQLGRVEGGPSERQQDILSRRQTMLDQPTNRAGRDMATRNLNRAQLAQERRLAGAQARMGVGGGVGQTQLSDLLGRQGQQRADLESNLLMQEEARRRGDIGAYEQSVREADAVQRAAEQFNISQTQKERFGELASGLAEAQIGSADRGAIRQSDAARAFAAANQGGGGKK